MQFIDYVKVFVKSGDGGKGCVSFRREKYVPRGGPDGGDGGRGGNVVIRATSELNTLLDLRYQREYKAERGQHGMGKKMHGRNGEDCVVSVPVGTLVKDEASNEVVADLDCNEAFVIAAKGGRGGLGNAHFATSTHQAPRFAQPGEQGEERWLIMELKLLADVGLVGLPNAGKSTLISVVSSAKPKIADYPFTTLVPNLGVVKIEGRRSFVIADIPGLIEGAHRGAGLGFQFLRHVERTSVLLHLVDVSDVLMSDPVEDLERINRELSLYRETLLSKPMAVAGTKVDLSHDRIRLKRLEAHCRANGLPFFPLSAVTGKGLRKLVSFLFTQVEAAASRRTAPKDEIT